MTPEEAFARTLRRLRLLRGLSQERLGFEAGLHRTYISQLERGLKSPTLSVLFRLADVLGELASDLVRETEQQMTNPPERGR